jgi:hypothetical protein
VKSAGVASKSLYVSMGQLSASRGPDDRTKPLESTNFYIRKARIQIPAG